jgi:hypothetical protein
MQRKLCHAKPPFSTIAACTVSMFRCQPAVIFSVSSAVRLAQRPLPVPRGEQGYASSLGLELLDGVLEFGSPHESSRKKPSIAAFPRP